MMPAQNDRNGSPRVVIVGAGFGGLAVARELGGIAAQVTIVDRRNHNLFQPLLYQVATAALSPADIAEPIRKTLARHRNTRVVLAEVTGVDLQARMVLIDRLDPIPYDVLVIATGSEYNYFGNDQWRETAPGLKSIREARAIRQRLLTSFEEAEMAPDEETKRRLLTSVVIGGGPTGVEMAGAIAELGRFMAPRDFRTITRSMVRVVLVEGGPRVLSAFPDELSGYALGRLEKLGVEVLTGRMVDSIDDKEVVAGDMRIPAGTVVWAAGVKASPASRWLGVEVGRGGHIAVTSWLEVKDRDGVYSLGDTATLDDPETGKPLPGLAQVAKQQGQWLGRHLRRKFDGAEPGEPFRFKNRGNTAVIGRNSAVFDFGWTQLTGWLAWVLWGIVHVYLLVSFEKRMLVSLQWLWRYMTRQRGTRLIDEPLPRAPQDEPASQLTATGEPLRQE